MVQAMTEQVSFSYATIEANQEQFPSPYLQRLHLDPTASPPTAIASPEEHRQALLPQTEAEINDPVLTAARQGWAIEVARARGTAPDAYDGAIAVPFADPQWTFSVSQLTQLGQCPFKWFAAKVLNLRPPPEPEDELTPVLRGNLYHKALEILITLHQEDEDQDLTDPALLNRTYTEAEQQLKLPALPAWEHRRPEQLKTLALVLQHPNFLPENAQPIALEQKFKGEWHGLQISGRVDRIDRTDQGLVLIDYKTGSSRPGGIKNNQGQAAIDLQLPLYQAVAAQHLYPDEAVSDAYYYSLSQRKAIKIPSKQSDDDLTAAIERCKTHLHRGHYPVQPDVKQTACTYCEFDALCRKRDRIDPTVSEDDHGTH
jgi:ATP-dependent helicase/DNAse subunit B